MSSWLSWKLDKHDVGSKTVFLTCVIGLIANTRSGNGTHTCIIEQKSAKNSYYVLSFFLSFILPSNRYKSVQTECKSGQDRKAARAALITCLLYTSPSPRD